jgi:hypothetical protein
MRSEQSAADTEKRHGASLETSPAAITSAAAATPSASDAAGVVDGDGLGIGTEMVGCALTETDVPRLCAQLLLPGVDGPPLQPDTPGVASFRESDIQVRSRMGNPSVQVGVCVVLPPSTAAHRCASSTCNCEDEESQ